MKFALEIGETERHKLDFRFNQLLGLLVIKVNDQPVKRKLRLFSEPVHEIHDLIVGEAELLEVKIEKHRRMLFGSTFRVFVNNRLVKYCEGV